jgi:2'-5' RNA ligase
VLEDRLSFAISLKAANPSAAPVRQLWDEVAQFEAAPSMAALQYAPHITLARYDDAVDQITMAEALGALAELPALRVTLTRLRWFDDPFVLWAEPAHPDLREAHRRVHTRIDPELCHPHYRPAAWVPHCTLGTGILDERRTEAKAFARERPWRPFEVLFDVADCVSFPPVRVLAERKLTSPRP